MRKKSGRKGMKKQTGNRSILSLLNKITLALLLTLAVVFAFRQLYSPDIGFHLKAGKWMLENFKFPVNDLFTYTINDHRYVDLQWLYQIFVTVIDKVSGDFGLVASNAVLVAICFALVIFRITRKVKLDGLLNWQLLLFLGITSLALIFEPRPHTFSWLYLNIVFIILDEYSEKRKNLLLFLPVVMVLWTNTHSIFIIGWIVIGSYMIDSVWKERRLWTPMVRYGLLSIGISIINPYFFDGILFPFRQFQLLQGANVFKNSVNELTSPLNFSNYYINGDFTLFQPLFYFHLFLLAGIIAFFRGLKRIQLHELLIFLFFAYLGLSAVKNVGFFVFAVLPGVIKWLQPGGIMGRGRMSKKKLPDSGRIQAALNGLAILLSVYLTISIITDSFYIYYRSNFRFGYKTSNLILPDKAAQYLLDHKLEGKILNYVDFGGFLMNKLPQKVAIDGRFEIIGEQFFIKYTRLWNQINKGPMLKEYEPQIVIFPHQNNFLWIHYFRKDTTWRLLYFDELSAVYIKKGYADDVPAYSYADQMKDYPPVSGAQIDSILGARYSADFYPLSFEKRYYPQMEMGLSTFCYYDDHFEEAVRIGLHGLMISSEAWPEMYYDLGHYFYELKEFERAKNCYLRYLETNVNQLASDRVSEIQSGTLGK
jgi:hypothetical protein